MYQPVHILNQLGVLASFSVAKKVTEGDINSFFSKQKKTGKNEKQIGKLLQEKILKEIQEAVLNQNIPGIITPEEMAKEAGVDQKIIDRMPELNRLIMVIVHKMSEKKYDKMSLCYFINSMVNLLGLTERDFEKFHRQNTKNEDDDNDDDDGDDEEGMVG